MCCQPVLNGKEQTFFVIEFVRSGLTNTALGSPSSHFEVLSSADKPFLCCLCCYLCCQAAQEKKLADLKRTVDYFKEEISSLKSALKKRENESSYKPVEPDTVEQLPLPPDTLSHHGNVVSRSGHTVGVCGLGRGII